MTLKCFVGSQTVPTTAEAPGRTEGQRIATSAKAPSLSSKISSNTKSTTTLPTKLTTPCPHENMMEDYVILSNDNIRTSSNQAEKDKIRPGGEAWTSSPNDTSPFVVVDLSDSKAATVTEVNLLDPVNVQTFTVTVEDKDGATIFTSVSHPHCLFFNFCKVRPIQYQICFFNDYKGQKIC